MTDGDLSTPRPRWAQLTYSSFDTAEDAAGGWQVKQTRGELTEDESTWLRSRIVAQLNTPTAMSQFPTREEIEAIPRRLLYAAEWPDRAGYWHTAAAGQDATGRPGNVFAHNVLDRAPARNDDSLRPVELWRSPDWLCPYGARAVTDAELNPGERPDAGSAVTRTTVLTYLQDPTVWRFGVLGALLDASVVALDGRGRVVIGVESADAAALWIGAISYLTAPATARRLGFSTYERAAGLESAWGKGVHVAAVPVSDVADLESRSTGDGTVVIDTTADVAIGQWGGVPHVSSTGSNIAVTPWSVIAQLVLQDPDEAEKTLQQMDHVGVLVGDVMGHPAWPLAMAMSAAAEEYGDAVQEIAWLIERHTPPQAMHNEQLAGIVRPVVQRRLGTTTADAWKALSTGVPPDLRDTAVHAYLERALRDRSWLTRPEGVSLPPGYRPPSAPPVALMNEVAGICAEWRIAPSPVENAHSTKHLAEVLRFVDLAVRAGLYDPNEGPAAGRHDALATLLEATVIPVFLQNADLAELLAKVGRLDDLTVAAYLAPLTEDALKRSAPGTMVSHAVSDWTRRRQVAPARVHQQPVPRSDSGPRVEPKGFALRRTTPPPLPAARPGSGDTRRGDLTSLRRGDPGYEAARVNALWTYLASRTLPPSFTLDRLIEGDPPFPAAVLVQMVNRYGVDVPGGAIEGCLSSTPWDQDVAQLTAIVLERSLDPLPAQWPEAVAYARLRDVGTQREPLEHHHPRDILAALSFVRLDAATDRVRAETAATAVGMAAGAILLEQAKAPGPIANDVDKYFSGKLADQYRGQARIKSIANSGTWEQLRALAAGCTSGAVGLILDRVWRRGGISDAVVERAAIFADPASPFGSQHDTDLGRLARVRLADGASPAQSLAMRVLPNRPAGFDSRIEAFVLAELGADATRKELKDFGRWARDKYDELVTGNASSGSRSRFGRS